MTIKILLVDDHTLFRSGLKALLSRQSDFEVIAEASDGLEGVKLLGQHKPDLVLLDLDMPVMSGIEALAQMREVDSEIPVVMLTVSEDAEDLKEALILGARGYLVKNIDADYLVNSIRQIVSGETVMSPEMTSKFVNGIRAKQVVPSPVVRSDTTKTLTDRERQILGCLAQGASNREMAQLLNMSLQEFRRRSLQPSVIWIAIWPSF